MSCIDFINKNILIFSSREYKQINYDKFKQDIWLMASYLYKFNRVILAEENSYMWLVVFFAVIYSGGEIHILDVNSDLSKSVKQINPDIVITTKKEDLSFLSKSSNRIFEECKETTEKIEDKTSKSKVLLYTTGTTNEAKAIRFTSQKIFEPAALQGSYLGIDYSDDVVVLAPFSHAYGLSAVLSSVNCARRIRVINNPIDFLKTIQTTHVDVVFMPPIFLKVLMLDVSNVQLLKKVRLVAIAGSKIDNETYSYYHTNGVRIINIYGSTETGMCYIGASVVGEDKDTLFLANLMEKKIEDDELLVRGRNLGECTAKDIKLLDDAGWYHTGDIVDELKNGSFRIIGRKDLIYVMDNGYKVKVEQLEEKIKKRIGAEECQILLKKRNNLDVLALVVEGENKEITLDSINSKLHYYERIQQIIYVKKIKKLRGKKVRVKREYIIQVVNEIINQIKDLDCQQRNIDNAIPFFEAVEFDSLNTLQFIVAIQERLKIKIEFQSFDAMCNYEDMINYIYEQSVSESGGV